MDPQKRETIEQMMRRDVASGNIGVKIKMPGENNSDELNDIVNYAPTSEYTTYETGRRDDAGNPIMSSDVMDLMMTKSYEPQKESDWSVSNIADSVYTMLRDRFHDGSVEPVDFDNPYYTKDMTAPPEPITGKDLIKGVMPESFQASKLYADYFYGEDEKREQIKKAHDLTGIRAETIANDPDVWEKVMKIVQRAEKLKKVPGMLDASGDLNMRRVYEAMPYLKEIVEKRGTNEAVMMLNNAEGLQTVNDAYSNEFMRFAGSVATGVERGYYNIRKQMTYANAMIGRRKLTEDEQNWITALDKKKDELPEYSYGGVGQTVGAMIGGAAENIPMIASAQGIGAVAGGIVLAATKNPGAAANVGRAAAVAVMGLEIGGSQYEENLNKLDAKGRAMYTPTQAAALSATQGLAEGVIEQLALQKIARTIFGRGEAKSLRDLYAGAGAKDLALAAEGATANEAARTLIKERILGAAKAGAITFNTELQEEFAQQVSDMVIENMAQMALKGDDAEISSVRKILQKSTAAAIEAAPSIMGFGLIGFGGHVGAHTNTMLGARAHMENLIKDRLYRSVNENQHLMNTVEAVGDNLKNVQELQGKAPDLVNEMLDSQNRRYGMETTSVDIVSLNQEEGGAELVQEIAAANNISAEELQACADGTGMLPVKTSTLQQMTTHLDESKRKALFQNITKSSDLYTDKQAQHEAKIVKEILGAFREKTEEEVGDSVDRYVESAFAEHEHRALARDILLADVNHPAAEIKRRMNRLDSDLAELTAVQSDGGAESAEYLAHIQPEIDKINAQKGALEAVAGTIKSLQHGDVVATAELSPEARGVYHELAGQLGNAKSKKARTAARASALLAARYADRMAKVYSEVQGKPYTAADYMREHLSVDARAYRLEEGLAQAARAGLNLDEQVQVVDIDALTNDLKGKTDQDILDYISKASLLPEVPTADFQALVGLPKDSDSYGQRHLLRGNANRSSDNRIARNITLSNFGDIAKNAVVVEVVPNTKKAPLTGLKGKKRQIQKRKNQISNYYRLMVPVQMNGHIKTLVIVAEEHDGVVSTGSVPVTAYEIYYAKKPPLAAAPRPKTGVSAAEEEAPLTISIRDMLTGVKDADGNVYAQPKKIETLEQSAWHGTPHDFDAFDLGGIGTGEGAQAHGAKGNITATLGGTQRLISLMESADQSTFMHEMAHNFLFDMEHLAEIAPESRYAKDLATIQNWASWTKGAADEYVGTASAAEFRDREEKILAAEKDGDAAEAERLKREWMQERFARGFEEYLRSGEAPAQGLRAVFRRFKSWLTRIYKDVTGAGVRASAEVEAIMARMIATDEEIEAAAVVKRAQRLQKIDPELLNADSAETMIQWETEAKERAKETLLKELIREMQGRDVDAHMEEYEAQLKAEMRENPVWQAEAVAETFGVGQVIASGYYPTAEAYEKALKDAGGGFDAAYNRQVREEREHYKTEMPNAEAIARRAEEVLASQEYTARQTALEGELLNEYIKAYDNAPQRLKDAMIGVARALKREEDAPLEKAVTALKYAFRWQEKQAKEIEDLRMLLSASKEAGEEDRTKMREKFWEAFNRLKLSAAQNLEAVRSLRDSAEGRVAAMRVYAQQHLENAPIHEAMNTRHWMRQVQSAAKEAERHLTNMLRKNNGIEKEDTGEKDFAAARTAKTRQLAMEAMTHESVKLKRELDRMVKYFARREKNLANDKTAKIDGNHRYFIHHLLYVFGLRRSDGVPLMGEGARSWSELMQEIKDSNDGFDGVDIPEWLASAATSRDTQRKYTELSMQELRDLRMLVEYLYVTGRDKNTLLTSGENIDEVAARMYQNYEEHIGEQDGGKEAHTYMVQLLKPETMLKVIGGKSGAIVDYLYNTLFDAQEKKTEALEKNAKRLEVIIGQYYTQKDRRKAWSKKLGINLTDGTELTKENVLSMALNWGNEGNRSRLVAGLSTKTPYTEKDVEEIFAKTMTKKDWAFVQEIWDYLNEHGDAVNEVVEKSAGTPMKRVVPDEFTIEASTGELLTIRGGYYPVRYDPKRSERAADQELATVAESVGGAMAFGSGMGSTKNRANGAPLGRPLDLSLDVMYRHIDQQIHIATMRLACRDVYKLLNHSAVKEPILQTLGKDAYDSLKRWVENTWQEPMNNNLYIETKAEEWRANTVTAIMAFRVSTALLNASNIMPMADRLGTVNAIQAMLQYLRHPQRIRQFVLNDSAFMRNRAHNMDRDLNTKGKDIFGGKNSVRKCLIKYGTWLMEETDMLCSVPTYYWTYQGRYNKEVADGTDEIIARERAHREAHEAVRSIFGSADSIDRSAVQRSQSGLVKAFTPFFSFFNAQMNAVWEKYYAGRYDKHKSSFVERYSGFVRSYLFRFVAMAAIETMIRQSLEAVSAGSGDKKDKDEWYKKFLKQWAANSLGSVASGFPVINMVGEIAQGMITGKLQQGRNSGVVFAAVGRLTDPIQMAYSLQSDKSKIDAIDFGRALTKGIAGTMYAVPDTLTDGFWNTARFMADNYRLNNPDDLREFIAKTILDKKLKQK
jgi:hypothetical protein